MTRFNLKYWADVKKVATVIHSHGILAGIRRAVSLSGENMLA
jgi:hypothetical protein